MAAALLAALIDVGGTLWPDGWHPAWDEGDPLREGGLRTALPASSSGRAAELLEGLKARAAEMLAAVERDASSSQRTDEAIREALKGLGVPPEPSLVASVCRAMALPLPPPGFFFPGAEHFLTGVKQLGLRSVVLSNTFWRDSSDYRRDFEALGAADVVDGIVTSLDVGVRKPHVAIFLAAVEKAGCEPSSCVMVGNSERMDVEPALALGMRAIRVAIEEPLPEWTAAHAVASSLTDAAAILRTWLT